MLLSQRAIGGVIMELRPLSELKSLDKVICKQQCINEYHGEQFEYNELFVFCYIYNDSIVQLIRGSDFTITHMWLEQFNACFKKFEW